MTLTKQFEEKLKQEVMPYLLKGRKEIPAAGLEPATSRDQLIAHHSNQFW